MVRLAEFNNCPHDATLGVVFWIFIPSLSRGMQGRLELMVNKFDGLANAIMGWIRWRDLVTLYEWFVGG